MALSDLTNHTGQWLSATGPQQDVVISSRVRLARNISGMPFLGKCSRDQQFELEQKLKAATLDSEIGPDPFYVDVASAGDLERCMLVERHLISRQHAGGTHPRGVVIATDETAAIMINEEDHLRIQVLRSGLQLEDAFEAINKIDDNLEDHIGYAYHSRYGYLTACPTNVGTGLRVSVMLHLPALKMTGEIERAFRAARDMGLAIRGLYGEGTEAHGDFFQISNQITLGASEEQIVEEFTNEMVPKFIDYERRARQSVLKRQPVAIDDKAKRSLALLKSAGMISCEEAMYLLSLVRLGVNLQRVTEVTIPQLNELFLLTQPAHLQRILGCEEMEETDRRIARAKFIQDRIGSI